MERRAARVTSYFPSRLALGISNYITTTDAHSPEVFGLVRCCCCGRCLQITTQYRAIGARVLKGDAQYARDGI